MRKFKIPNMGALLAFEASARHESFTHAAKELFLTESAISRQIATLESNLGVRLFVRAKQRVVLTRAGRLYGTQVRRALENLDRDTLSIIAHGSGGGYLELAVLPTFASQWLIPRLKDFNDRTPDVRINMGVRTDTFSFEESHFEAAIHYGKPTWPGTSSDYLFGEEVVPICSPSLLSKPIKKPHELLAYPLLHSTTRPDAWTRWLSDLGVEDNSTMQGVRYELHTMLISAAAAGLGVALVPKFFVEGQLKQLGLIIPFEAATVADSAYYLVYPTELSHGKPLELFRTWLLEQASAYKAPKP
ncbi:LysR substrate-binding domain-containing protein [Paraburkholderia sp. SEWSISQ10-3 4]|uniref:LysR substrate-binding domain-containing protein n=1 Tax=Paraburkholderia TaxID=1822464 RepID=UPI00190B0358|nr:MULTISPECIES: LysR substrate-binding domain-containing protein [Paraburkholderia]MBK3840004.1 LysR family transcriptional regulator [Paraburkholderia aspalathi]MCX4140279.1 LysR substrate-binding domain-containing protein [Paraburkholderia aspalathi]MDN7172966.1 LysR substrate-binding domain-containing protein [Paraburkholderia sp. SEWSISQ10-3 4]MDQ6502605.1 LysR substrate-binding domain-containing protein [Paraburkholderia aspalathi]CAE6772685.1 Glycine cleavage system transcriptional acti